MDHPPTGFGLASLIPIVFISIPFAIGFYHTARRLGRSPAVWVILTLIPIVNYFFAVYAGFVILFAVLDRLQTLGGAGTRSASR
jgi:hypothetical protein